MRFQSAVPNRHGRYPGIFALANGLARDRLLTPEDHQRWRGANDRMNAAYAHPTQTDPQCYDPQLHPHAAAWFKTEPAADLIAQTRFYCDLLDRYDVPWVELRTTRPGRIHFEDDVQVVTTPWLYPDDWFFRPTG